MIIGAHITKEASILKTIQKIKEFDCNALQLFASNPRSISSPNLDKINDESPFIFDYCNHNKIKLVIHAPYTINLASSLKVGKRLIDIKDCYWVKLLIENLKACDIIGAVGCVVHVGKFVKLTPEEGLENMRNAIKFIIEIMKEFKINSKLMLETPAGQGTELLTNLDDFINFYNSFTKTERKYFKICIDTAHLWSAGYDPLDGFNKIAKTNEEDILVIHLNNSKKGKGSQVDVHDDIFSGEMDPEQLIKVVKKTNDNMIIILEKPSDDLKEEIKKIKSLL